MLVSKGHYSSDLFKKTSGQAAVGEESKRPIFYHPWTEYTCIVCWNLFGNIYKKTIYMNDVGHIWQALRAWHNRTNTFYTLSVLRFVWEGSHVGKLFSHVFSDIIWCVEMFSLSVVWNFLAQTFYEAKKAGAFMRIHQVTCFSLFFSAPVWKKCFSIKSQALTLPHCLLTQNVSRWFSIKSLTKKMFSL